MKVLDELLKLTLLSLHQKFRPLYFHYFLLIFFYYTQTFHFFFLYKRGLYKSWKELLHNFISFVSLILCLQLLLYRRQRLRQIISAAPRRKGRALKDIYSTKQKLKVAISSEPVKGKFKYWSTWKGKESEAKKERL